MTSEAEKEAFVWIWLPGEITPVVAGRLEVAGDDSILFNYGKSYLERTGDSNSAIPIYEPELPLGTELLYPPQELSMAGCIRDAAPDGWGRRVILNKKLGRQGAQTDTAVLGELTYLLESGSDRIGALDFQASPTDYVPRIANSASMEGLMDVAGCVERGVPLSPGLDLVFPASSIGGGRPKAMIEDVGKKYVAKFSSVTDLYNVVKAEFIAMRLAALAGLDVAPVRLMQAAGKDVLLIERFDRIKKRAGWSRRLMVSALTLLGLDEMMARYASYEDLAEIIRYRFTNPKKTLAELFSRLVFNILCGNTDDHARNHAAFWNGSELALTPAYDICPQWRTGGEASQAMLIAGDKNLSQLKTCLDTANNFLLSEEKAREIFNRLTTTIKQHWDEVCKEAELSETDKSLLWGRQFLNPFSVAVD